MSLESTYKNLFFPHARDASERVLSNGSRFAYYTTAQTALSVIRNQEIWMRHTGVMNDYREVEHGLDCLTVARASAAGAEFSRALELCYRGISNELNERFSSLAPTIRQHTYVTSVSEHVESEDRYGRLSMWRAYGGNAGVALILNGGVMLRPSDAIGAHAMPVAYMDAKGFADELLLIAYNIQSDIPGACSWGREGLLDAAMEVFRYASVCTKHPSFEEEREWRVVATQDVHPSSRLRCEVEVIGGIPQKILKFKLKDYPEEGLQGLNPSTFIENILIGPCEYPAIIKAALVDVLTEAGIENAESKIKITGIPLRSNQR